jgi:hypothetical protein
LTKRFAVIVAFALAPLAAPAAADAEFIDGYRVKATGKTLQQLAEAGYDMTEGRRKDGTVEIFGTPAQAAKLKRDGIDARKVTDEQGTAIAQIAPLVAPIIPGADDSAYTVWRKYDAVPSDGKEQYAELYDRLLSEHADILEKRVVGQSVLGRDIVALQLTKDATGANVAGRPAVVYNALQHAREWLAGETCARSLDYFLDNYGEATPAGAEVTSIVDSTELWFMCVANPDGYEYTFSPGNRLWRKNLHDNDGDGQLTSEDGVDPNRNFPTNWGLDKEGSSSDRTSETYRGTGPASEPETQAMIALLDETQPVFQKNDHTAASLLLYPQGWQQDTPTADDPIFRSLAGDDENPAIEGSDPDLGAELYITNGDTNDFAYSQKDVLSYTPEGTPASDPNVTGFEFEDDEAAIEGEFQRHLPFVLDMAQAAADPAELPGNQFGAETPNFEVDSFKDSYGTPQAVQANVKRSLGAVEMRYQVNGGPTHSVDTKEFTGGERYYREDDVYYHRVRGRVTAGAGAGDKVKVWFVAGGEESGAFTYTVRSDTGRRVLVLAAEDYTGASPGQDQNGPHLLDYYTAALAKAGLTYDVYDVDDAGRRAPDPLGVLSHYDAVVWYTGEDIITREPGQPPGTASKLANDIDIAVRDYINEGGKTFLSGKYAGFAQGANGYAYDPEQGAGDGPCTDPDSAVEGAFSECIFLTNDFSQYYLGSYLYVDDGGSVKDEEGNVTGLFPSIALGSPFAPFDWTFNGPDSAGNQDHSGSFLITSTILKPDQYPRYADSRRAALWDRPGAAPFDPFTGSYFAAANADDASYKRLRRTVELTGKTSGALKFKTSFDLEQDYDYVFVEAHPADDDPGTPADERDQWTTLPESGGHTSQDTGLSCPTATPGSAWQSLHPFLAHYQTQGANPEDCTATGTTGSWNAATGGSGGWQDWNVDLSAYAGKRVEVSITVATDPASLGVGLWVDDTEVTADGAPVATTSFEDDLGGWEVGPPPEGTESQKGGWERTVKQFDEGGVVVTNDTVYTGFGLEGITGADKRGEFMRRALAHLGVRNPSVKPPPKPSPGAPATPGGTSTPKPKLRVKKRQKLSTVVKRGLEVRFSCRKRCRATFSLAVDRATAKRLGLRSRRLARRTVTITGTTDKLVRIKLSRATKRKLRGVRRLRLKVSVASKNPRVSQSASVLVVR